MWRYRDECSKTIWEIEFSCRIKSKWNVIIIDVANDAKCFSAKNLLAGKISSELSNEYKNLVAVIKHKAN